MAQVAAHASVAGGTSALIINLLRWLTSRCVSSRHEPWLYMPHAGSLAWKAI